MNDKTVSTERLEEIAAEYGDMAGKLDGSLKDGPGAASAFYMSCSLGEIKAMATELLASRTSPVEPRAWEGYWPGAGSINSETHLTKSKSMAETWAADGAEVTPLYTSPAHACTNGGEVKPTHRHKKRGTEYVLIGTGKMQAESWVDMFEGGVLPVDDEEVAIYRSATDPTEIWVRPREEFEDGRFEALKAGE